MKKHVANLFDAGRLKGGLETGMAARRVSFVNPNLANEISRLSPQQKLQLVEELWDFLAASPDAIPLPAWHENVLAEDQAAFRTNPSEGSSWSDVMGRIADRK